MYSANFCVFLNFHIIFRSIFSFAPLQPIKHSPMEEAQAHGNATFTISDGSSPSNLDQDSGKNN